MPARPMKFAWKMKTILPPPSRWSWMTEAQGAAVKDFVFAGGGFYPLHNASHISLSSKNYREVMGGASFGHPALRPFQVRATHNAHLITQGIKPFIVNNLAALCRLR